MGWSNDQIALLIISAGGSFSGLFVYSPSPGTGNLVDSIAAAPGTDPYGNGYLAGITTYGSPAGVKTQMTGGSVVFYTVAGALGNISLDVINGLFQMRAVGGTEKIALNDASNNTRGILINPGPTLSVLLTGTAAVTGPSTATMLEVQGTTALQNATAPAAVTGFAEPFAIGGNLAFVNGLAGDGNTYDTGILHADLPSTGIGAVTPAFTTIGTAVNVGIGKYKVHVHGYYLGAAAAVPRFSFAVPASSASQGSAMFQQNAVSSSFGSITTTWTGPAMASVTVVLDGWAEYTFTAAGTLQFEANTSNAADNYTWTTGTMEVWPVN